MLTSLRTVDGEEAVADLADNAFRSFDFSHGALVAVSGGGDSNALLLLLKKYLDANAPAAPLLAATVDHELRPESALEAQAVAALCASHGIAHKTLPWRGDKPATGLPAAAREARYRLLADAAGAAGIDLIVTAHTADDQAETVLMRSTRGAGLARGHAGMAPATLYDWRTWIARPLLATRREALRGFLRQNRIGWFEDPTNNDEHYERPRIRAVLRQPQAAPQMEMLLARAHAAADERLAASSRAACLIERFASRPAPGLVRLDSEFVIIRSDAAVLALRVLLASIGGTAFVPDETRTAALFDRLAAGGLCATLSRTVVDARRAGIFLYREQRNLPPASTVTDGMIWDGRRRVNFRGSADSLVVEATGYDGEAATPGPESPAPTSLVAASQAAEPVLRTMQEPSRQTPQIDVAPLVAPYARFLPSFDIEVATAVSDLLGACAPPAPPFTGGR